MDKELIAYLEERFREIHQQFQGLREDTGQQIQGLREETAQQFQGLRKEMIESDRHTRVLVEHLHGDLQLVAKVVQGVIEQLNSFKAEVAREFQETRRMIEQPYREIDTRVRDLEIWRERTHGNALELLRERFGRKA